MSTVGNSFDHSSTNSLPTAPIEFDSYQQHEKYVNEEFETKTTRSLDRELWLGQFPVDGRPMQWYHLAKTMDSHPEQFI